MGAKFRQPPFSVAEANIISKSITANGTYNASSDNADGYNPVNVNVTPILISKTITENGTYTAQSEPGAPDGFSSVTVNVTELDGIIFGESDPVSSQGANGDYYYKRWKPTENGYTRYVPAYYSNSNIYGQEITPNEDIRVSGIRVYCNVNKSGYVRIGTLSDILVTSESAGMMANTWNTVLFSEPIALTANTTYIIQCVMESTPGGIAYTQSSGNVTINSKITNPGRVRYGGFPGTVDSGSYSGVDLVIESDLYKITDQYIKVNGIWTPITI